MTTLPHPIAAQSRFADSDWASCTLDQHQLVQAAPVVWPGFETRGLYSAEQLEAYATARVREALEEAAKQCEGRYQPWGNLADDRAADCMSRAAGRIRALIPPQQ